MEPRRTMAKVATDLPARELPAIAPLATGCVVTRYGFDSSLQVKCIEEPCINAVIGKLLHHLGAPVLRTGKRDADIRDTPFHFFPRFFGMRDTRITLFLRKCFESIAEPCADASPGGLR
ncbi:hypothetical protein X942_5496 [Burkholderia pseudomallei MSHR5596]|nr:hypothetical protein X942_5496 [Burkholderia pseudomallei MSHR5596]